MVLAIAIKKEMGGSTFTAPCVRRALNWTSEPISEIAHTKSWCDMVLTTSTGPEGNYYCFVITARDRMSAN